MSNDSPDEAQRKKDLIQGPTDVEWRCVAHWAPPRPALTSRPDMR